MAVGSRPAVLSGAGRSQVTTTRRPAGGANHNVVGGPRVEDRNVISGNDVGVLIIDPGTDHNRIQNNLIGTDRNLQAFRGGGLVQDTGVHITREARFNAAGGPAEAVNSGGNTIAFHEDDGVLVGGQFRAATDTTDANSIRFNSIHSDGGDDGIRLGINFDSGFQGVPGPAEGDLAGTRPPEPTTVPSYVIKAVAGALAALVSWRLLRQLVKRKERR